MATDGILLMGLSLIVTILGTQAYYRIRGQPINNAVAGLVIGMCTGALVFSEVWWRLIGFVSHRAIQLDSQVRLLVSVCHVMPAFAVVRPYGLASTLERVGRCPGVLPHSHSPNSVLCWILCQEEIVFQESGDDCHLRNIGLQPHR